MVTAGQVVGVGPLTVEAWVRPGVAGETGAVIVGGDDNSGWSVEMASGQVEFWVRTNVGWQVLRHPTVLTAGQWAHVAATYQSGQISVFVNGVPAGPTAVGATLTQGPWLRLGGLAGYPFFNGALDEVRISNVVRYTAAFTPSATLSVDANTLRLWRFDEGVGQTTVDAASGAVATLGATTAVAADDPVWLAR
jgi:hypothetical protein